MESSFLARSLKNICANCMVYGWKQEAKNKVTLRCTGCKIFYYCGRECQEEHWKKTHRQHCTALSQLNSHAHDKANCKYCTLQTSAGSNVTKANNPNYVCPVVNKWLISQSALELEFLSSVTNDPDDLLERLFLTIQRLALKRVITGLTDSDTPILGNLQSQRLKIYLERLQNPKKILVGFEFPKEPKNNNRSDVFQTLETLRVLNSMACGVSVIRHDQMLKRPEKSLPAEWRQASRNLREGHLLKKIRQILEALEDQVVPHRRLVEIVCEGNVEQNCKVCKKKVTVTMISNSPYHCDSAGEVYASSPFACILPHEATGFIISCGSVECQTAEKEGDPVPTWMAALASTYTRLKDTRFSGCI